ncbi:unnamed protein product [Brassica oleracea var. botrytis]|uniref:Uncharacterized protein n=1 Tax=Brassica carinata TaxID=52824 RepID=A0A8X7RHF9_BRACI|nr:hypothetical protein Bca52824_045018 [Brassica carinata]
MGEINDDDWRNGLDISGLSLMDEDDSLLLLFPDPTSGTDKEDRGGLDWFGEDESSELHKYNLRKSVLEPDELCHMIESNHVDEKKVLAAIQEDVKRSTESISTLKSDCTVETSEGCVLFEDVRASIQRSSDAAATPDKSKELGERDDAVHSPTPSTLGDPDSNEKVKPNAIRKRPSIRAQGLGKVTKQALAGKEHNTSSISRPSTGLSRSVRASVDVNKTKQGESPVSPRVTISRRVRPIVSKPGPPSKSALRSSKNELTSSCSSLESCISASSSAPKKSPLESANQKKSQSSRTAFHSMANGSTSRAASRVSPLSASSTFKSRLPCNASFLSASVDWSFNSPRASTPNKMAKGKNQHGSMTKPTGLRVPSPKLGYFDGGWSSVARTPTGSCTGGSAKHGARCLNEPTASSRTKSRLVQESTNSKTKARPVSRSSRLIVPASASSPKVTSKTYSKVSAEERLNGDAVEDNLAQ